MSDQEKELSAVQEPQEDYRGFDAGALNLLSMLHLNSAAATTAAATTNNRAPLASIDDQQCTKKRQSPSSLSLQEPSSKRANIQHPSTAGAGSNLTADNRIHGFTKLPLPPNFSNSLPSSSAALHRCISDPNPFISYLGTKNVAAAAAASPSPPKKSAPFVLPHLLHRTVSDPTSVAYQIATTTTPPKPLASRTVAQSPSPNTKRLKRMKDRLRQMSQWWNQVIQEDDEDSGSEYNDSLSKNESEVTENGEAEPSEEAVWVERKGDCLILHFKCPCGKGYQVLLSGKNCYYKLTTFSASE